MKPRSYAPGFPSKFVLHPYILKSDYAVLTDTHNYLVHLCFLG